MLLQQFRAEAAGAVERLFVLPGGNLLRIAGKEDLGHFPAVEFCGTGIDRWGQEAVLEGVGQGGRLVAQGPGKKPHHGVGYDGGGQFAAAQDIIPYRYLARDQVLPDPVVHTFVMAAENHDVFLAGEFVGQLLGERLAVGRSKDDIIVGTFGFEFFHQRVNGLNHHHHAGVAAETVVIDLAVAAFAVLADVVDMDFDEPSVAGPLDDGVAERALEQLRNDCQDIDSHRDCKNNDYLQKKIIFASYN